MSAWLRNRWARVGLVAWTIGIWGSRVRNIAADDDLTGAERAGALVVALGLLAAALVVAVALVARATWLRMALGVLVVAGVVRWTIRGPIILVSDEWEIGFKVVHTILWLVTVALSVLAWREQSDTSRRQHDVSAGAQ